MAWIKKRTWRKAGKVITRWDARVYGRDSLTGKQRYANKRTKTEREAKDWAREQETLKGGGVRLTTDKRTLATYLTEWLERKARGATHDRRNRARAPRSRTLADCRALVQRWLLKPRRPDIAWLGHLRLDQVTTEHLDRFYDAMVREGTAAGTARRLHALLGQALHDAVRKRILARNPTDLTSVPQVDTPRDVEPEDEDVMKAMTEDIRGSSVRVRPPLLSSND
jgi:Arm DNA-binding domain